MNDWDPRQNPLVERAFRVGFRKGPGSFRSGWLLAGLALVTVGPFLPRGFNSSWSVGQAASWMLVGLLILIGVIFVVGGLQRMLTSFSQERERGTFDFLHLSALRSSAIVLGFLMAGQLPAYFALVLLGPLAAVAAALSSFPLGILAAMLGTLVLYALAMSVVFLYFGFWTKKSAEYRGAALVYAVIYTVAGAGIAKGLVAGGILPADAPQLLVGAPVILGLHSVGAARAADMDAKLAVVSFFGLPLPQWLLGVLLIGPPVALVFLALCRALRHRDSAPWALRHALPLFAWGTLALVGVWWGTMIPFSTRVLVLGAVSWLSIRRLADRNMPTRARTVLALGRAGGDLGGHLRSEDGPPILLVAGGFAAWVAASALFALECARGDGGGELLWALAPALFLVPILAQLLAAQWLAWRAPSLRWAVPFISGVTVLLPFLAYIFAEPLDPLPFLSKELLEGYGSLSPFTQLYALGHQGDEAGTWTLIGQVPHLVGMAAFFVLCRRAVRELARRSRSLLAGIDGEGARSAPRTAGV